MDAASSLRVLAERARQVQTLSGEGLITLTRPDGESVRLDAAIAMRPPERARLRAWKFGRAIFDLTVAPDGVWVVTPDDPKRQEQIRSAGVGAGRLARAWSVLSGGFFDAPGLTTQVTDARLRLRREAAGEPVVLCEVDRRTLTPRRYSMLDDRGVTRFTLTLDRYQTFGSAVWPTKLVATSDGGTVEVDLRQVDVNPELPPAAFTPPRRAERLP
jgi:outer membrane lipoprotein-sorting protein